MKGLKEQLLEADPLQAEKMLTAYLRRRIAFTLNTSADQVGEDYDVSGFACQVDREWLFLSRVILKDLGLRLYPNELRNVTTIGNLARYILGELKGGTVTASEAAGPDSGGNDDWMWGDPRLLPKPVDRNRPIVFVLSAPRSGSTLLRVMLGGHPALFSPPELCLLPFSGMGQRNGELLRSGHAYQELGFLQAVMEINGLGWAEGRELLRDLVERDVPIPDVYRVLQESAGSRTLIDKTTHYAADSNWLRRAEDLFEGAKYIHLYRHPYAVTESFLRMRFDKIYGRGWGMGEMSPPRLAEKVWATFNGNILGFLEQIDLQRQLSVRYEDLVSDPESVSRRLCGFLGVPFDEAVPEPYRRKNVRDDALGDPNFHAHDSIDTSLGEAWKRMRPAHQLGPHAKAISIELDYDLPGSEPS